jgi:hypothetical protein
MLDLKNLQPTKRPEPPRGILYGSPKIGKTSMLAEAPNVLFIDIEGGSGNVNVARVSAEQVGGDWTYVSLISTLESVRDSEHDFSTLVIDSADWMERLIHNQVAEDKNVKNIEDIGYGKGYVFAINLLTYLLDILEDIRVKRGMAVFFICHSHIKRYDDPTAESYDRHQLKLHAKVEAILTEWSDVILFATNKVAVAKEEAGFNKKVTKGKSVGRVVYTEESPAFLAGNRYGLPNELPLSWSAFEEALTKSLTEKKD